MPELGEQMYCSQQICIPPTFPYLLRQFAKAAIRTQPNDLLKWSTAYFRCLSLNIPPPVKPRLEYPIPRDYSGITPGWLRALLHQLHNNETVSFKVLWDRWIGACLQHNTLIQILVLGGFTDNQAIPWLRFIALCAAHLTDNLTQTMILICEILTEEPEGGSAMIPVQIFNDLYKFLAAIEASYPQTLRNYYFLDKFLELYQEKIAKDEGPKEIKEEIVEETTSYVSSESSVESGEKRKVDDGSIVSCPSVSSQDPDNFLRLMAKMDEDQDGEEEEGVGNFDLLEEKSSSQIFEPEIVQSEEDVFAEPEQVTEAPEETITTETTSIDKSAQPEDDTKDEQNIIPLEETQIVTEESKNDDLQVEEEEPQPDEKKSIEEKQSSELIGVTNTTTEEEEIQHSVEVESYLKQMEIGTMAEHEEEHIQQSEHMDRERTKSQVSFVERVKVIGEMDGGDEEEGGGSGLIYKDLEEQGPPYEEVFVEAIPGIGGVVPLDMVDLVCQYMLKMAAMQHNMVMPRNIRHYECPPLHPFVAD